MGTQNQVDALAAHTEMPTLAEAIAAFERDFILHALQLEKGVRARAADRLGISRKCLWEKLRRYEVTPAELLRLTSAGRA